MTFVNRIIAGALFALAIVAAFMWALTYMETGKKPSVGEVINSFTNPSAVNTTEDLIGKWETTDPDNPRMAADVLADSITIDLLGPDSSLVYWHGSFSDLRADSNTITSNAIEEGSLALSTASTKDFVYENGRLSFEITAMGVTKTVQMTRK